MDTAFPEAPQRAEQWQMRRDGFALLMDLANLVDRNII
jgi:hypothetical protein